MLSLIIQCQRHVIKKWILSLESVFLLAWMMGLESDVMAKGICCAHIGAEFILLLLLWRKFHFDLWKRGKCLFGIGFQSKVGPKYLPFILLSKVGEAKYHTSHLSDIGYSLNLFSMSYLKDLSSYLKFQLFACALKWVPTKCYKPSDPAFQLSF